VVAAVQSRAFVGWLGHGSLPRHCEGERRSSATSTSPPAGLRRRRRRHRRGRGHRRARAAATDGEPRRGRAAAVPHQDIRRRRRRPQHTPTPSYPEGFAGNSFVVWDANTWTCWCRASALNGGCHFFSWRWKRKARCGARDACGRRKLAWLLSPIHVTRSTKDTYRKC
jgi:hypothetical protein